MKMKYEVCYIDDHILPYGDFDDTKKISSMDFTKFLSQDLQWPEDPVRDTVQLNLNNANKFKQISFYGFKDPQLFLNYKSQNGINPNTIIMDWDYGFNDGSTYLDAIISNTQLDNLFILSGNAPVEEIRAELASHNISSSIHTEVFEKSQFIEQDIKTHEEIVSEYNKTFFELSEIVNVNNIPYTFHPSTMVPMPSDLWMLESIIGSDEFRVQFSTKNNIISHRTIEEVINNSKVEFYLNRNKTRIYSKNGLAYAKYFREFEELEKVKPIYALKNYELFLLEQAVEKCYANILEKE